MSNSESEKHKKIRACIQKVQQNSKLSAKEKQRRIMALVRGDLSAMDWPIGIVLFFLL